MCAGSNEFLGNIVGKKNQHNIINPKFLNFTHITRRIKLLLERKETNILKLLPVEPRQDITHS